MLKIYRNILKYTLKHKRYSAINGARIVGHVASYSILSLLVLIMQACSPHEPVRVRIFGQMRSIMMEGDLSASVQLDTLTGTNLYGLGVCKGLSGEIILLNNKVYVTSVADSLMLSTTQSKNVSAALFVAADVPQWEIVDEIDHIENLAMLDSLIGKIAIAKGINVEKPIVFKIDIIEGSVDGHVIRWKEGVIHTHENHKQFAITKTLTGKQQLLGFFSKHHQGIFTHHSTFTHVHALGDNEGPVLHVDALNSSKLKLYFGK